MGHQQGDGWPLGLQPLNVRIGLVRNRDFSGSVSFNTLLTASSCSSTDFSSELDTESSVGSFFHDRRSITLGSLIGVSSIIDLSRRSSSIRTTTTTNNKQVSLSTLREKKSKSLSRVWFFCLCYSKQQVNHYNNYNAHDTDTFNSSTTAGSPPSSLAHFLEAERRAAAAAANDYRTRIQIPSPNRYEAADDFIIEERRHGGSNSLFVNGYIAAPPPLRSPSAPWFNSETPLNKRKTNRDHYSSASSLLFSCIRGQPN